MVHDFAWWRNAPKLVREVLPGVRAVIDHFLNSRNESGLVAGMLGWNFLDWVPSWKEGVPPSGTAGASCASSWQTVLALRQAADLEDYVGETVLARRDRDCANQIVHAIDQTFWNERRGLNADDPTHAHFSEHAQYLAVLAGLKDPSRGERMQLGLLHVPDLARASIYFSHYLLEAYRLLNAEDAMHDRLLTWSRYPALGLKTLLEQPEPSRSDCHAWASHPLFHYFASVLGIRSAAPGFGSVDIRPQLGALESASGTMAHPRGTVRVNYQRRHGRLTAEVELPAGVSGSLSYRTTQRPLHPGAQKLELQPGHR